VSHGLVSIDRQAPCSAARCAQNRSGLLEADWYGQLVADLADLSPDRYAPLIAPVLERLTFAVVRMSVSRPASTPAPGGASAGAMRMFAQLRTALAARTVTAAGLPRSTATVTPARCVVTLTGCARRD
jgi:hypothetical protein